MNIRKIVTYNSLRKAFTPEELVLAEVLYNASESERQMIVESLQPQRVATRRKRGGGKSARASSLAEAIKSSPKPKELLCTLCGNEEGFTDHAQPSPNFHEFQTAKAASAGGGD
jgi:hypothetical protein